ncbi:hypothetical protein ACFSFZ_07450 [Mixta tenebrionis]|uniref:Uncharacterized protein n=1 Tax=Mixta tenebrionis TaxID=2562439 RepID=A0A506V8H0_9GAMM|nr:hypothetical protein [Mixta tenebrionis]TPW41640.1 hypothetical protein FKM52_12865 [Mixta tenebrionis]
MITASPIAHIESTFAEQTPGGKRIASWQQQRRPADRDARSLTLELQAITQVCHLTRSEIFQRISWRPAGAYSTIARQFCRFACGRQIPLALVTDIWRSWARGWRRDWRLIAGYSWGLGNLNINQRNNR